MLATPKILYRPGTQDTLTISEVLGDNEYRLPPCFAAEDVILDIGANIGIFAIACLERGAGKVVCYEPGESNFDLLSKNVGDLATVHKGAVWGTQAKLTYSGSHPVFTACGSVVPGRSSEGINKKIPVTVFAIDDVIRPLGDIRLMKLDCEGSEFSILLNCTLLHKVKEITGEVHEGMTNGSKDWTMAAIKDHLENQGFVVETQRNHVDYQWLFWAKRTRASQYLTHPGDKK